MGEIAVTIAVALVSGGLAGAGVSWWTSTKDRELVAIPTLQLERDRFEHQRTSEERAKEEAAFGEINDVLNDCFEYANTGMRTDTPDEVEAAAYRLLGQISKVYMRAALTADP